MNINNHPQTNELYPQNVNKGDAKKLTKPEPAETQVKPAEDKVELSKLDALRSEPEVRPEVVAKGKELLKDPSFPSKEIVDSIAKLIVPFDDDE